MASDAQPTSPIYEILLTEANQAVEEALLEALPQLPSVEALAALDTLIERNRPPGMVGVLIGFRDYADRVQQAILDRSGAFFPHVRAALEHSDVDSQASAIEFIRRTGDVRLSYLLAHVLGRTSDPQCDLADAAGRTLVEMTNQHLAGGSASPCREIRWLAEAVGRTIEQWDRHRRVDVLKAALRLIEPLEKTILDRAQDPKSSLGRTLGGLLASSDDPELAGYALRVLAHPHLRTEAVRKLQSCRNVQFLRAMFRHAWVLSDPEVADGCRHVRKMAWVANACDLLTPLAESEVLGALKLVSCSGMGSTEKLRVYGDLLDSGSDQVERAAFWCVATSEAAHANRLLRRKAADGKGALGELAKRELRRREVRQTRTQAARGVPQRPWNALQKLAPRDRAVFDAYWHGHEWTDRAERVRAGRDLCRELPATRRVIDEYVSHGSTTERIRALRIRTELDGPGEMDDTHLSLLRGPDPFVRATAVSLAAGATAGSPTSAPGDERPGPTVRRLLHAALRDADSRVQANAVEALQRLAGADDQTKRLLRSQLQSPNHRVRANAVVAMLTQADPTAADSLKEMLESPVAADRLSALWVIQRLQLSNLTEALEVFAYQDPDWRVRRRASSLLGLDKTPGRPAPDQNIETPTEAGCTP